MSRILLIDADPGERLIVRSRLVEQGHEVLVAESGARGLAEARSGTADLVLMASDLGGGVDGAEVCRRLKGAPALNRIPVVVYATHAVGTEVAERMYDAGCEVFVGRKQMPSLDRMLGVHLRLKAQGDDLSEQNRMLELENRRLEEERQRAADLDATADGEGASELVLREIAAGRPDGVLVVDVAGAVRHADRGASELLGSRLIGTTLGMVAPGCGLEAFVRDARNAPREGFRFDISARKDRNKRSLMASVMPVTAGEEGQALRVVLLLDVGKRRVAEELLHAQEPSIPRQQLGALIEAARATYVPEAIVGVSDPAHRLRRRVADLAGRGGPVLVRGERGVGRELIARVLHYSSNRTGCFLQLRCAGLAPEALELELFGAAKGATPGLVADRPGMLLQARGGTVYLSEVPDLPLEVQERLFDALDSGVLVRSGSRGKEEVDCRIVASSSRDLGSLVAQGSFHAGLAELLMTQRIEVPPLRERSEDVQELARVFVGRFGPRHGAEVLSEEARWVMEQYDWPGNVAELEDCIEQACSRVDADLVEVRHLTRPLRDLAAELPSPEVIPARRGAPHVARGAATVPGTHMVSAVPSTSRPWDITEDDPISLDLYEKKALLRALDNTGGDKLAAARLLQVGKSTLYRKLKKFGIS